jgi:hypothetical protein
VNGGAGSNRDARVRAAERAGGDLRKNPARHVRCTARRVHKRQAPIHFPCTADFASMRRVPGGRFCETCREVVVDLSELGEKGARTRLAAAHRGGERVCIRYVYDAGGAIVFGADAARARVVPEHALTRKLRRAVALAATATVPLLVQACGGNGGGFEFPPDAAADAAGDAGDAAPDALFAPPDAGDAGAGDQ